MTETQNTPAPTDDDTPVPGHLLPMSNADWRYSLGDDGRRRGVYMRGGRAWHRVAPLPYVTERLTDRDGDGRRSGMRFRMTMDLDEGGQGQAAICDPREITAGDWANKLDVPLSADRKVRDAVATAIFEAAHAPGVAARESVPGWVEGELVMPPADVGPDGYLQYAADEDRAREAWRELAEIVNRSPKLGLCLGGSLGSLYVAPLRRQSYLVELIGGARLGKSTALYLAAAALGWAGTPEQPEGTLRTASSSAQGMPQLLRALACLPVFADETGTSKRTPAQREEFIMTIAQGATRTMGDRSGVGGRRTARWSGVYFASGNEALAEGVTNEGTWTRVVSIPTPITTTPADARRVPELVPLAYGWPLQWVMRAGMDVDGMRARVARAENAMPLPDGGVGETMGRHLALMVAGAGLFSDLVGTDITAATLQAARDHLAAFMEDVRERGLTPADRLVSAVRAALASHPRTFPDVETYRAYVAGVPLNGDLHPPQLPSVLDGFVPDPGRVAVFPARLGAVAAESGITDPMPAVRDLYLAGGLITDKGRRQKTHKVDGKSVKTYTFVIPDEDDEATADEGQGQDADGGPAGNVTADEAGTSPETRTGDADEATADGGQVALVLEADGPADEAPAAVPTGSGSQSGARVPSAVPNGTPTVGNLGEPAVTSENAAGNAPGSQSSQSWEPGYIEGTPVTGNPDEGNLGTRGVGTPRPRAVAAPPTPNEAGHVLAVTVTPDTLYLAGPGDTIRTEDPGPLVGHLGRLLDWVAGVLPPGGGTIAVDGDAADALGWPYDMERPEDRTRPMVDRPRCVEDAAAHGWTTRTVGGWTTWERGERGTPSFASVTVACLPWMDRRALGTGADILLDADDDAGSAVYLLARVAALVGQPFAYTAGSTFCMAVRNRYYDRHGQTRRLKGKSRRPMMRLNNDEARGAVCPAFVIPDGGMTWRRAGATAGGDHEARHVMGLDAIGQHLGTAIGGSFAVDPLVERDAVEWDPRIPGLWELDGGTFRLDEAGPSLAGPAASTAGTWWAHTETVKLLIEYGLHSDVFSTRAWVPVNRDGDITRGVQILRPLAERIRDAIQSIPRDTADDLEKRVRATLKSMYAEAAGELTRHPFVRRPDWSMGIWSGARAQTLRRAVRVWQETGTWPIEIVHDCLYYETGGIGPEFIPAPGVLKYDEDRVKLGHVKMDFPDLDAGQAGTMAEYVAKRGGEPTARKARKSRKGGK